MHPNPTHDRVSYLPALRILSPTTAASVCPVTFSFPLRLVLLVRPAQHTDHRLFLAFFKMLSIFFESVQAPFGGM